MAKQMTLLEARDIVGKALYRAAMGRRKQGERSPFTVSGVDPDFVQSVTDQLEVAGLFDGHPLDRTMVRTYTVVGYDRNTADRYLLHIRAASPAMAEVEAVSQKPDLVAVATFAGEYTSAETDAQKTRSGPRTQAVT